MSESAVGCCRPDSQASLRFDVPVLHLAVCSPIPHFWGSLGGLQISRAFLSYLFGRLRFRLK